MASGDQDGRRELIRDPSGKFSRREWLRISLGSLASAFLLPGCRPPWSADRSAAWEDGFRGLLLFGMSGDYKGSRLTCADFDARLVRQLELAMPYAHHVVYCGCDAGEIWVLGNAANVICRVDAKAWKVLGVEELAADGFVTSGHGLVLPYEGGEALVTSEYPGSDPGAGGFCLRSPKDLRVLKRVPSRGRYPHVLAFHDGQLVVQNLGHEPGQGEQYAPGAELAFFEWPSMKLLRRVKPAGTLPLQIPPGRPEKLRASAEYQTGSKHLLYPERRGLAAEQPEGPVVSLWESRSGRQIAEIPLPGLYPTHSYQAPTSERLLVACRGSGLVVVEKKPPFAPFVPEWLKGYRTDMHVGPLQRGCEG